MKIEASEQVEIQKLREESQKTIYELGQKHFEKLGIKTDLEQVERDINIVEKHLFSLVLRENDLIESLSKKYGNKTINIETGDIID